jgi:hypothetical protein
MLPLSSHQWRFCRESNCDAQDLLFGLRDRFWAAQWLEQFKGDSALMAAMRSVLAQEQSSWQLSSMPDQAIVAAVADLLSCGVLHVHTRAFGAARSDQHGRQQASSQSPESAPSPPLPRSAPAPAVPVIPMPGDPPTFSPDMHLAAQVATLVAAAAQGSAFCEH